MKDDLQILVGDSAAVLKTLPSESVNCCVTSPPYWGLRDYGHADQIGQEATPELFVQSLVKVFREVRRVLKPDATVWLNLGDCYAGSGKGGNPADSKHQKQATNHGSNFLVGQTVRDAALTNVSRRQCADAGYKPKDLIGIPWMAAFALRADGWWLRSEIIWHKPNPMPESVTDRPTCAHEKLFLLAKSAYYYCDMAAIREPASPSLIKQVEEGYNGSALKDYLTANVQDASATKARIIDNARKRIDKQRGHGRRHEGFNEKWDALTPAEQGLLGSNKRNVWTVAPSNYREAHFATYPPDLIAPCILAGCPPGGVVLDPFFGSGTTGLVSVELGRKCIGIELNPAYAKMAESRTQTTRGFAF